MIRIHTPSRLHFGLLSLPSAQASVWLNQEGQPTLPRRQFGGVGLMIDRPGMELTVEPANTWAADGALEQRALRFGQTYCAAAGIQQSFHVRIASAAPEHAGLGTGTQLGLAVARAIAELTRQPARDAVTLARLVGRGLRSALGVHGFDQGGFLVEGGKTAETAIAPLLLRADFPLDWRILLITPRIGLGTHDHQETQAFVDLAKHDGNDRITESLCRLVLLGMLPALQERDIDSFGEALYDFNRRVGEMFQPVQGGLYAQPRIESLVRDLRDAHVKGVGQTSWGPTVFAIVRTTEAAAFCDWLARERDVGREEILVTEACNRGAEVIST